MSDLFHLYTLAMGVVSFVGLVYMIYSQQFVLAYRRFLSPVIAGVFVFAVGGPLTEMYYPDAVHLVHGSAALLVTVGLYSLLRGDQHADEWTALLLREPSNLRHPSDWMVPMDEAILELFHSTHLVLTPSIVAYNTGYSREEVNRRLTELTDHHLVERVDRGKYRITSFGERYLWGVDVTDSSVIDRLQSKLTDR